MKKKIPLLILAAALLCIGTVGIYSYFNVDLTGAPYSEIQSYMQAYPNKNVTYTVTIEGGDSPLELTEKSTAAALTDLKQTSSLIEQAEYLQHLEFIFFGTLTPDAEMLSQLRDVFPNTGFHYDNIMLLGKAESAHSTVLTLESLSVSELEQAAKELKWFPALSELSVTPPNDTVYTAEDAAILAAALPDVTVHMTFDLFGQQVSTDMERIEYFKADIGGDAGLDIIRSVMPIMDRLTYLKLDWCGTSDEATAALRDELADQCKVVWRVFFYKYNALTDTLKIWANGDVNDRNNQALKYCTEVRYLDMGHTMSTHCEWARYMPNLEVVIFGDCRMASIEPLRSCPNIKYLELFTCKVTDLSPLEDLKQLEYLNISNLRIDDITPLYALDNLIKLNSTMNGSIPQEQIDKFRELQPRCDATFLDHGDPTAFGWRFANGVINPRYALLRQQFGYLTRDDSCYPHGYVTEPITYESTGITPPEV